MSFGDADYAGKPKNDAAGNVSRRGGTGSGLKVAAGPDREAPAAGLDAVGLTTEASSRAHYHPGAEPMKIKMVVERCTGRLRGAQIVGGTGSGKRIDVLAAALWNSMAVAEVAGMDLSNHRALSLVADQVGDVGDPGGHSPSQWRT